MSCKYTIENITNAIGALVEKGFTEDADKLYNAIVNNVQLSDHFHANPNSTSQLNSTLVAADIDKSKTIQWLTNSVNKWVASNAAVADFDKFMNSLGAKKEGWQSVVALLYTTERVPVIGKDGVVKIGKTKTKTSLDENVAKAIGVVSADWVANTLEPMMAEHRSDVDIRKLLGLDKKAVITPEIRKSVANIDTFYTSAANELGNRIYRLLGIKANSNSEHINNSNIEASLKTELGMLAIAGMESSGLITVQDVTYKKGKETKKAKAIKVAEPHRYSDGTDTTIGLKLEGVSKDILLSSRMKNGAGKTLSRINEVVEGKKTKHGVYTSKLLAVPTDDEIVNDGPTGEYLGDVVAQETKDAVKNQSSTAYKFRKGFKQLVDALQTIGDEKASVLQRVLGYADPREVIDVRTDSVKGKNRQIQETIDYLDEAYSDIGTDTAMYARWKAITNNRFMIDSNKLNWQDKKLHRYSVYHTASKVDTPVKRQLFHLMLAQAFDLPIDKKTAESILGKDGVEDGSLIHNVISKIQEVVENATVATSLEAYMSQEGKELSDYQKDVQAVMTYITKIDKGTTNDAEKSLLGALNGEPEHLLSGVSELLQYMAAGNAGEVYETTGMIETDAITSGYGIKNMQFPIILDGYGNIDTEKTLKELEKVGVFTEDSKYASYGHRVEGKEKDSYEEPAEALAKRVNELGEKIPEAFIRLIDPKVKFNEDGTIETFSRSLMKSPFMVLNYGAGISSITDAVAKETVNNLYKLVEKYHNNPNNDVLKQLVEIEKFIGTKDSIAKRVRDNAKGFKLTDNELNAIYSKVLVQKDKKRTKTFGNALENEFQAKYGHFIDLVKLTNESLTAQFKVARVILDERIQARYERLLEKYKDKSLVPPITKKEITEIVQELKDRFPVLDSALTTADGKPAPILIAKTEKASYEGEGDVELLGNTAKSGGLRTKSDSKRSEMTSAAMEVYKLVQAYSSGAVVPIHFFDSAVQSIVLNKYKALGVHDANYFTLDDVISGTKYYNENWYELNKEYSLMDAMVKAFEGTFKDNSPEVLNAIKELEKDPANNKKVKDGTIYFGELVKQMGEDLANTQKKVQKGREFLYSQKLRVEHAYFPTVSGESAAYVANAKADSKANDDTINPVKHATDTVAKNNAKC